MGFWGAVPGGFPGGTPGRPPGAPIATNHAVWCRRVWYERRPQVTPLPRSGYSWIVVDRPRIHSSHVSMVRQLRLCCWDLLLGLKKTPSFLSTLDLAGWLVAIGALFSPKHGHRGKSSFFHQIIFRTKPKGTINPTTIPPSIPRPRPTIIHHQSHNDSLGTPPASFTP